MPAPQRSFSHKSPQPPMAPPASVAGTIAKSDSEIKVWAGQANTTGDVITAVANAVSDRTVLVIF